MPEADADEVVARAGALCRRIEHDACVDVGDAAFHVEPTVGLPAVVRAAVVRLCVPRHSACTITFSVARDALDLVWPQMAARSTARPRTVWTSPSTWR